MAKTRGKRCKSSAADADASSEQTKFKAKQRVSTVVLRDESDTTSDSDSDFDVEALAKAASEHMKSQLSLTDTNTGSRTDSPCFIVDKKPSLNASSKILRSTNLQDSDDDSNSDEDMVVDSDTDQTDFKIKTTNTTQANIRETREEHLHHQKEFQLSSSLQDGLTGEDNYINVDAYKKPCLKKKHIDKLLKTSGKSEVMKRSVITSDFEKKYSIPPFEESLNQLKKQRRKEREMTKGKGWFDMPATEQTEQRKNDLLVLQYRRALDPKRFYKGPDIRALPKYYQMGTVVESAADFYNSRIPKKQRKKTLVDELLADAEFRKFNKRKYTEIQESQRKSRGAHKHMKRLKKKK